MKTTNHLTPQSFYNDFLDWLVLLDEFHSDNIKPPMSANQFYWAARLQWGCGLRISELLKLIKADFDLEHKILTIRNHKTKKGGIQKTTIMPYDIAKLKSFLEPFDDAERIFPTTRSTMWRYYKNASKLGGLNLFEAKDQINIEGAWTHLMRSSCAKMYESLGAEPSIISTKLRYNPTNIMKQLDKSELNEVLDFESQKLRTLPFDHNVSK